MPKAKAVAPVEAVQELTPVEKVLAQDVEILELEQGSQEWLETRMLGRPASEAACIMSISPYDKPFDVWERKTGVTKKKFEHPGLKRGKDYEDAARQAYEDLTGLPLEPVVLKRGNYIASLDGQSMFGDKIGEIKITTTDTPLYQYAKNGELPPYYMIQVQQQLMVSSATECDFFVRVEKPKTKEFVEDILIKVLPDPEMWAQIVDSWDEFWVHVDTLVPPEKNEIDHTKKEGDKAIEIEKRLNAKMAEAEKLDEEVKAIRAELDAECSQLGRHILANGTYNRGYRKGNVQYKQIPQLKGVNLELYRAKPSPVTTYRKKGEAEEDA